MAIYIAILAMTVFDIVATTIGLSTNLVVEANPIMAAIIGSVGLPLAMALNLAWVSGLLYLVYKLPGNAVKKYSLAALVVFKIAIIATHGYWIVMVLKEGLV